MPVRDETELASGPAGVRGDPGVGSARPGVTTLSATSAWADPGGGAILELRPRSTDGGIRLLAASRSRRSDWTGRSGSSPGSGAAEHGGGLTPAPHGSPRRSVRRASRAGQEAHTAAGSRPTQTGSWARSAASDSTRTAPLRHRRSDLAREPTRARPRRRASPADAAGKLRRQTRETGRAADGAGYRPGIGSFRTDEAQTGSMRGRSWCCRRRLPLLDRLGDCRFGHRRIDLCFRSIVHAA
jgi:hypothetical protein